VGAFPVAAIAVGAVRVGMGAWSAYQLYAAGRDIINCLVSLRYPYLFYKTICYYKVVPMWKTKVFHIGTTQKADTI
jgi:hypothetical protein